MVSAIFPGLPLLGDGGLASAKKNITGGGWTGAAFSLKLPQGVKQQMMFFC
jgi:hypothetical protein